MAEVRSRAGGNGNGEQRTLSMQEFGVLVENALRNLMYQINQLEERVSELEGNNGIKAGKSDKGAEEGAGEE